MLHYIITDCHRANKEKTQFHQALNGVRRVGFVQGKAQCFAHLTGTPAGLRLRSPLNDASELHNYGFFGAGFHCPL